MYLHKLTFGEVFPAAPDTRRRYQTAKGSWSRAAGVIVGGSRGRLSSSFIRVQVNMMMMMMVLMMAPERAESPSCRQQEEEKRCFPASARAHTHHASSPSQKYIILCLLPFIGCCVLGGEVQVRCPTNEGRGLQFTTSKMLFWFYPLQPKTSRLIKPPQPNTRSHSAIIFTILSLKNDDNDGSGNHQIRCRKMSLNAPVNVVLVSISTLIACSQ